jgi:c-di-GMP-binding flagellar brake protein YcgR
MINNDWNDDERREYERYSVMFYLAVHERGNDAILGQIVDISLGGIRLLSEQPIPVGARLPLVMDVSLESGLTGKLPVEAACVWSEEDDNPGFYLAGFQFIDLTEHGTDFVQAIIDELQ